ncbi:MAG: YhfC family intramembrane metalloprotease [Acutalibacter sp.]|nr:YhfC family intramembrane metalloprotease [Acutalibacter sp.]
MNDIVLPSPAEIQSSIVNLGIMCLVLFLLPMLYVLVWKKRCGRAVSLKPMVIGAVGFLVTVRVLELGVHLVCIIQDNPVSRFINGHTWAYVLYGASMAGIFEECGRYVILRFLMKRNKSRENYVMYGIGHGGIEVWAVVLMSMLSFLALAVTVSFQGMEGAMSMMGIPADAPEATLNSAQSMVAAAVGFTPMTAALSVFERVCAMFAHIGFTVIVAYGVETRQKRYLLGAILAHALLDVFPALYQRGAVSMAATEIWAFACAAGVMAASVYLYRKFPQRAAC